MFPYFEIFGKTVGSYAMASVAGMAVCVLVACRMGRSYKIAFEDILLKMVYIGIGLIVGGHALYGVTHLPRLWELLTHLPDYTFKDAISVVVTCFGGMVFYGGFLGGMAGFALNVRKEQGEQKRVLWDIFAVVIPLFHTFGRIGCFLGGCCYGKESSWGFIVYNNTLQPEINGVVRIPVQLIEAACNFCIFLFLFILFKKNMQRGKLLFYYMLIYPVARFILEFFRGDAIRGFLWGLSTSQWISILLFLVGLYQLLWKSGKAQDVFRIKKTE